MPILHPTPSNLRQTPRTLHPTPWNLHQTPETLNPEPETPKPNPGKGEKEGAENAPAVPTFFSFFFITLKPRVERYNNL